LTGVPAEGAPLTAREREVLQLAASGLTYQQIGRRINLGVPGVKSETWRARRKLGAESLAHAVHLAGHRGLIGWHADCGRPSGYNKHLRNGEPPCLLCRQHSPNGVGDKMSVIQIEHFGTVDRMLRAERMRSFDSVRGELLRLCGQLYFRMESTHTLEEGIRVALSAVNRLADSPVIRVAEPAEGELVSVMDEIPNVLGSTTRLSRQADVPAACPVCSRGYRRSVTGSLLCTHTPECWWGQRMMAG
jgi:DNA-binding CsgD family transcriptional regulator